MEQAFGDLRALMAKAGEMVALAEYFKERVATKGELRGAEEGMRGAAWGGCEALGAGRVLQGAYGHPR